MVAIKAIFEIELDISRFTCRKVSAKIVPRQIWGLNSSEITEIRPASFSSHVPEPIKTEEMYHKYYGSVGENKRYTIS